MTEIKNQQGEGTPRKPEMERRLEIPRNFARPTGKSVEQGKLRKSQLNLKAFLRKLRNLNPR
jgi:hypothetical protein